MDFILKIIFDFVWFYCLLMQIPLAILPFVARFLIKNKKFQYTVTGLLILYVVTTLLAILSIYLSYFKWWFLYEADGMQFILVLFEAVLIILAGLLQLLFKNKCKLSPVLIWLPLIAGIFYALHILIFPISLAFVITGVILNIIFIILEILAIVLWIKGIKNSHKE